MNFDFIFIGVLAVIFHRWFMPIKGLMDAVGLFMGMLLVYSVFKIPGIIAFQGWRNYLEHPVEPVPLHHFVSGAVSFGIILGLFIRARKRKERNRREEMDSEGGILVQPQKSHGH